MAVTYPDAASRRPPGAAWPAYAAAGWALIFAVFHLIWASGWYVALDQGFAQAAFARPGFLLYDLAVAAACLVAVPVALAPVRPWGRRLPRRVVGGLAWSGTGLLVLRSAASLIQTAYLIATRQFAFPAMGVWELWFYVGAALFGISTWRFWRGEARRPGSP